MRDLYRLKWYRTNDVNKFQAEQRLEYLGDGEAIFHLWFLLTQADHKHVEVYNLDGHPCNLAHGMNGLI